MQGHRHGTLIDMRVTGGMLLLLAIAGATLLLPRLSPFLFLYSEVFRALDGTLEYGQVILLVNGLVASIALGSAWVASRGDMVPSRRANRALGSFLIVFLTLGGVAFAYVFLREELAWKRLAATSGVTTIVHTFQHIEHGLDEPVRGVVVSSAPHVDLEGLGREWPASLLNRENSLEIYRREEDLREVLKGLHQVGFFGLPTELDPRPRLDDVAFTLAVYRGDEVWRVVGRPSDAGFDRFWEAINTFRQRSRTGVKWAQDASPEEVR